MTMMTIDPRIRTRFNGVDDDCDDIIDEGTDSYDDDDGTLKSKAIVMTMSPPPHL